MNPILFLDVDGVLNDHAFCEVSESCTIKPQCMAHLNSIIHETDCDIVLTSAWRYIIHGGEMTLKGFEYLLRTHGLIKRQRPVIIGVIRPDKDKDEPRAAQVSEWVKIFSAPCLNFAILDDGDFGFSSCDICKNNFVRISSKSGLNHISAMQVTELLKDNECVFGPRCLECGGHEENCRNRGDLADCIFCSGSGFLGPTPCYHCFGFGYSKKT